MFKPVDPKPDFPKMEEEVLDFWREKQIFARSLKKTEGQPAFVFFEGPPTANGRPGLHHVEARAFKDVILRFQTMLGKHVLRKAGWDTHGLPVEIEVEKSLGISGKRDIENLVPGDRRASIEKFNRLCRENVWRYKDEWEQFTDRMGFWIDMTAPYVTYDNNYIETVWWIIKELWNKKLVYQGHKVMPFCTRCGTALSSHEVAQGYRSIEEKSVFIKFKAKAEKIEGHDSKGHHVVVKLDKPTYILSWTTTPWTLPGNVALAVGGNIDYAVVAAGEEYYILAADLVGQLCDSSCVVLEKFKGKDLAGIAYEPLFDIKELNAEASYKVYLADFVSTQEGTGVVHTAVMYGEDDYNLGTKVGLPKFHTVDEEGRFVASTNDLAGRYVKDEETEKRILHHLQKKGMLFKEQAYRHDYPFCWRCGTPLLYYARNSWFIRMSELRPQLLQNNRQINWVPDYFKEGRFGGWLAEAKDWAISRDRYWGTPLPFWQCESCKEFVCIGSITELEEQVVNFPDFAKATTGEQFPISNFQTNPKSQTPNTPGAAADKFQDLDLHRPNIDELKLKCKKCGKGEMARVPEVLDVWFDSGAMPFAQWHYPFENKETIECGGGTATPPRPASAAAKASADKRDNKPAACQYPADYISEALDQTRGWFYTLLAIATALGYDAPPYKNVICLGHILDSHGQKMSKSKGNVVVPKDLADKYGMDIVRWYMYSVNQPGEAKLFAETDLVRMQRRVQLILWNVYNYFITYANIGGWEFDPQVSPGEAKNSPNILDQWIAIRLQQLINSATEGLSHYNVFRTSRDIEQFIDDLSTWYLRRSRGRFDRNFFATLYRTLVYLVKILAPLLPFLAEKIYSNLSASGFPESVHLDDWPKARDLDVEETKVLGRMKEIRVVVETVLAWRKNNNFKVRQPLARLHIVGAGFDSQDYLNLLAEELNIADVSVGSAVPDGLVKVNEDASPPQMFIDPILTPELKSKGLARELERLVQDLRKESGFKVGEQAAMFYETPSTEIYDAFAYFDQSKTYIERIIGAKEKADFEKQLRVGDYEIWLGLKRIKN